MTECSVKYNMMDFQAAIGIHQVARVENNWVRREAIWNTYQDAFGELPVHFPADSAKHMRHTYHLCTLLIAPLQGSVSRNLLLERMTARQIGVGVHYLSMPEHSYYQRAYGWRCEYYPHAMRVGRQTVNLPLSPKLTAADVQRVIRAVHVAIVLP